MSYLHISAFSSKSMPVELHNVKHVAQLFKDCFFSFREPFIDIGTSDRGFTLNIGLTIGPHLPSDERTWKNIIELIESDALVSFLFSDGVIIGYVDGSDHPFIDKNFSIDQILEQQMLIDFVYFFNKSTAPEHGIFNARHKELRLINTIYNKEGVLFLGINRHPEPSVTCPCCGFITLFELNHVYEICDLCDWEDDPIQFEFPDTKSGANKFSLREAQNNLPVNQDCTMDTCNGFIKDKKWSPLSPVNSGMDGGVQNGVDYFNAV